MKYSQRLISKAADWKPASQGGPVLELAGLKNGLQLPSPTRVAAAAKLSGFGWGALRLVVPGMGCEFLRYRHEAASKTRGSWWPLAGLEGL